MKYTFPNKIFQFVVCILISLLICMPLMAINLNYNFVSEDIFMHLFFLLVTVFCILIFYIINKRRNTNPSLKLLPNKHDLPLLLYGTMLIVGIHFLFYAINNLYSSSPKEIEFNYILFFGAVLLAPIFEELIFRQYFLSGLLAANKPLKSIVINSIIFGLVHIQPRQIIMGLLIGLLLSWIFYKTKKVGNTILLHFISNFSAFIIPLAIKLFINSSTISYMWMKVIFILFGLILLFISVYKVFKNYSVEKM